MRLKTILLLVVAGTCGLVAMLGVQQVLLNNSKQESKGQALKVLVAVAEILPGQALDEKNVQFKQMPVETIPEGAVTTLDQIKDRSLKVRAFPGDLITVVKLDKNGKRNASSDVPKGMRAVAIPIDPTMTGSGLIRPGDKVDVLVSLKSMTGGRDQGINKEIKTVLECIEVFAIDGQRDSSSAVPEKLQAQTKNVALLVNSEQAKLLKLAGGVGDLHLTLRGNDDDQRSDEQELFDPRLAAPDVIVDRERNEVTQHTVSQVLPVENSEPTNNKKWKIEIFKGSERVTEEVDLPDEVAATPTAATDLPQKSGQPWMGTIRKLFGG